MNEIAIKLTNVSKVYYSYAKPRYRLQEMLKPVLGKLHPRFKRNYADEFWALKNISFELKKGESLGIIGRNGAGKSTLLQIIAGTLTPTSGEVIVNGRVNALLELGSGFNPEFTGRGNVYMNGSILGFSKEEIDKKFQQIHEFSEIGDFIDQPVRTYSSGMFVRLAFAVQAMLEPDILIVDEALSVGDIFFQQKCARYMDKLRENGTTLLFVTHDMSAIERFCKNALLLNKGSIELIGNPREVITRYYYLGKKQQDFKVISSNLENKKKVSAKYFQVFGEKDFTQLLEFKNSQRRLVINGDTSKVNFVGAYLRNENGQETNVFEVNSYIQAVYVFQALTNINMIPMSNITIVNKHNTVVHCKGTWMLDAFPSTPLLLLKNQLVIFTHKFKATIAPGEYIIGIGLAFLDVEELSYVKNKQMSINQLNESFRYNLSIGNALSFTITPIPIGLEVNFYGLCDLESIQEIGVVECVE